LTRGLVTAFLVLAGAEEGNEECNYLVVRKVNKRRNFSRTTVDDRRTVIVRSKVDRPLT